MKVIIKKGKENEGYYCYQSGELYFSSNPYIYPDTANEKGLIKAAKIFANINLDFSEYEFRKIEIKLK